MLGKWCLECGRAMRGVSGLAGIDQEANELFRQERN